MFGPLTSLRLRGAICPCLLSTDESIAKQSDSNLQTFLNDGSCTVKWHSFDSSNNNKNKSKSIGGFISKMITSNNDGSSSSSSSCVIIESKVELIDTKKGSSVCLDISAINTTEHQQIPFKSIGSFKPFTSKPSWTSNLTNNIHTSSENSNIVSIYSKKLNNDIEDNGVGGKERELARLEFTHHQDNSNNSSEVKINAHDICEYLTNIWNWDEARRLAIGEEEENNENENDEETTSTDSSSNKNNSSSLGQPGTMKGRAQKAAHFAKREIELQQKKREREQRKAKYLKEAGGLKYTAIAMANRS